MLCMSYVESTSVFDFVFCSFCLSGGGGEGGGDVPSDFYYSQCTLLLVCFFSLHLVGSPCLFLSICGTVILQTNIFPPNTAKHSFQILTHKNLTTRSYVHIVVYTENKNDCLCFSLQVFILTESFLVFLQKDNPICLSALQVLSNLPLSFT